MVVSQKIGRGSLNYSIYDSGLRGANIRVAEKELRNGELDLEISVEQARFETSKDYYSLQSSDAQVKIEEAAVADATQTLKVSTTRKSRRRNKI